MDTYLNRGNAVLCTLLACLTLAALGNHFSTYLISSAPTGDVSVADVYEFKHNQALQSDQAHLALNIKADLSSCFNWNTKQLFLYVVAKYETPKNKRNEVILWDRVATHPQEATLELLNEMNKYPLRDYGRSLRNRTVALHLEYVYHPIVGVMKTNSVASTTFTLPTSYFGFKGTRDVEDRKADTLAHDDTGDAVGTGITA